MFLSPTKDSKEVCNHNPIVNFFQGTQPVKVFNTFIRKEFKYIDLLQFRKAGEFYKLWIQSKTKILELF